LGGMKKYAMHEDILDIVQAPKHSRTLYSPLAIPTVLLFQIYLCNIKYLWLKKPCAPITDNTIKITLLSILLSF
jgi:hypothetical protein